MGDAPIAYVEGAGGTRVAEDQIVAPGKNDVSMFLSHDCNADAKPTDIVLQSWQITLTLIQTLCLFSNPPASIDAGSTSHGRRGSHLCPFSLRSSFILRSRISRSSAQGGLP